MKTATKNLWPWGHVTKPLLSLEWTTRLCDFTKLIVGFSGGLDSTILLHALISQPSLRNQLIAVHINHGISSHALAWQKHCEQFCLDFDIPFIAHTAQFDRQANIEEHARTARYAFFSSMLGENDCLLLAHHQDDQAETVLLQLFRGAGIDGLAAMTELSSLDSGTLARPFLSCSRQELEHYAALHQLKWVEDESNQDLKYSRNYLRQQVMPLLKEKWPGVVTNISRTAAHSQQAKANLEQLAILDSQGLLQRPGSLFIEPFKELSVERMTNVLRFWLQENQIKSPSAAIVQRLIHELIFARADATPVVAWNDIEVRRYQQRLYLERKNDLILPAVIEWTQFPDPLILQEYNIHLRAVKANNGLIIPEDAKITLKFRQGGEAFCWHNQTKQLKKLFQEWGVPPWLRDTIPLFYIDDQLAAVIGYATSDLFYSGNGEQAWELLNFE